MKTAAILFATVYIAFVAAAGNTCPKLTECSGPKKYDNRFKCRSNYNCNRGYSCCPNSCYTHKICMKTSTDTDVPKAKPPSSNNTISSQKITVAYCPSISCSSPPKTDLRYLCTGDDRCPDGYMCCHTQCYTHKVCRKAVHDEAEEMPVNKPSVYCEDDGHTTKNEFCPSRGNCDQVYDEKDTIHLACCEDGSCSPGYSCCADCRYAHPICRKSANATVIPPMLDSPPDANVPVSIDENGCLIENKYCELVPYKQSKYLECISNSDCPQKYSCCSDKCYTHNICKKRAADPPLDYSKCPQDEKVCNVPQNLRFSKLFQCSEALKCGLGQVCCPSSCFGYNVCKDPVETVETPKDTCSKESIGEITYRECPPIPKKCTEPYSMGRMLKLKCETDGDCQDNMMCCYNSCAKFKICSSKYNMEAINKHVKCGFMPIIN